MLYLYATRMSLTLTAKIEYLDDIRDSDNPRFMIFLTPSTPDSTPVTLPKTSSYQLSMQGDVLRICCDQASPDLNEFRFDQNSDDVMYRFEADGFLPHSHLSFVFPTEWGKPSTIDFSVLETSLEHWSGQISVPKIEEGEFT